MHPTPRPLQPGQESVWDYPRPPRLEPTDRRIRVVFAGTTVADTTRAIRVLERSHPPTYYIPAADIEMSLLVETPGTSFCEFKGRARYAGVHVNGCTANRAAWYYPTPYYAYAALREHYAFFAHCMDGCFVDGERVQPQHGSFYGGWITSDIAGPFKGEPGTRGW